MAAATQTKPLQHRIFEEFSARPKSVDRQSATIRGVKVLGTTSINGRDYEPAALDSAVRLYENVRVYIDHPGSQANPRKRSYRDKVGRLVAPSRERDGIYADLQLNPNHPMAESILWDAENSPETFGMSQMAFVKYRMEGEREIVGAIVKVESVDLVSYPATTKGLFEGDMTSGDAMDSGGLSWQMFVTKAAEVYNSDGDAADKAKRIGKLALMLLKVDNELSSAMDAGVSEGSTSEKDFAMGEEKESGKEAEAAEKKAESAGDKDQQSEKSTSESAGDSSANEPDVKTLHRQTAAYKILAECQVVPSDVRVKALAALDTDDERRTICESWREKRIGEQARSGQRSDSSASKSTGTASVGAKTLLEVLGER